MRVRRQAEAVGELAQHIVFRLAGEEYALPLLSVREIVRLEKLAPVPKAPPALRGVMSLRGEAVPVLDLSFAFGHGIATPTAESCVLVAEAHLDEAQAALGLAVDGVSRLLDLPPADIVPRPRLGRLVEVDFIRAMAREESGFVPILDLDSILGSGELRHAAAAALSRVTEPSADDPAAFAKPGAEPAPAPALEGAAPPARPRRRSGRV